MYKSTRISRRAYLKPLYILFPDTMGIQWVDTDATEWQKYA